MTKAEKSKYMRVATDVISGMVKELNPIAFAKVDLSQVTIADKIKAMELLACLCDLPKQFEELSKVRVKDE